MAELEEGAAPVAPLQPPPQQLHPPLPAPASSGSAACPVYWLGHLGELLAVSYAGEDWEAVAEEQLPAAEMAAAAAVGLAAGAGAGPDRRAAR